MKYVTYEKSENKGWMKTIWMDIDEPGELNYSYAPFSTAFRALYTWTVLYILLNQLKRIEFRFEYALSVCVPRGLY